MMPRELAGWKEIASVIGQWRGTDPDRSTLYRWLALADPLPIYRVRGVGWREPRATVDELRAWWQRQCEASPIAVALH